MNDQDFQTCVALRLGINLFEKYKCICGSFVDGSGTHGLSCPNAKGTFPRHLDLNQIIKRALTSARHSCSLEPIGLSRDDGKRPDGVTLAPWSNGKRLVWDVTCVDTLAPSYLNATSKKQPNSLVRKNMIITQVVTHQVVKFHIRWIGIRNVRSMVRRNKVFY